MISTSTSLRLNISKNWPFRFFISKSIFEYNFLPLFIQNIIFKKIYIKKFRNMNILFSHSIIKMRGKKLLIYIYLHDEYIDRFIIDLIRDQICIKKYPLFFEKLKKILFMHCRYKIFQKIFLKLIYDLAKLGFCYQYFFKIFLISNPSLYNVFILGNYIKRRLIQGYNLNKIIQPLLNGLGKLKFIFNGIKFKCIGRFTRAQRVATHYFQQGQIAFNTFNSFVDYNIIYPILKYSICSIKIWINYKYTFLTSPYHLFFLIKLKKINDNDQINFFFNLIYFLFKKNNNKIKKKKNYLLKKIFIKLKQNKFIKLKKIKFFKNQSFKQNLIYYNKLNYKYFNN
jgi:hypothetical protein